MIDNIIKDQFNQLNDALKKENSQKCIKCLNEILPVIGDDSSVEILADADVCDFILRILKLLHKNTEHLTK